MPTLSPKQVANKQLHALTHLRKQLVYSIVRLDDLEEAIRTGREPTPAGRLALIAETTEWANRVAAAREARTKVPTTEARKPT